MQSHGLLCFVGMVPGTSLVLLCKVVWPVNRELCWGKGDSPPCCGDLCLASTFAVSTQLVSISWITGRWAGVCCTVLFVPFFY